MSLIVQEWVCSSLVGVPVRLVGLKMDGKRLVGLGAQ